VAAEIDRQVKQTIDQAHEMAIAILKLNRELLESTTQILLDKEVLEGDVLKGILTQVKVPEGLQNWLMKG
jgi:cell division protease FtsH